jgi:hypothetical protein
MTHRVAVLLLALAGSAVLLASPEPASAGQAVAGAVEAAAPDAGRPAVGECHAVTPSENQAPVDPDPAVPCTRRHTTVTYRVATVPRAVVRDLRARYFVAYRACRPGLARALRGNERTLALSAFQVTLFGPSRRRVAAGARWVRCDVYLPEGMQGLRPLPTAGAPVLGRHLPLPDHLARCGVEGPGGLYRTTCSAPHDARAVGLVPVRAKRYPGERALYRLAQRRCPALAGSRWTTTLLGAGEWPAEPRKWVVCFRVTAR